MPGGAVEVIPSALRDEICALAPDIDWHSIKSLSEQFQIESLHDRQAPRDVRKSLSKVVTLSVQLRTELLLLSEEARNELFDQMGPYQDVNSYNSLIGNLSILSNYTKAAHNTVEPKRANPGSLRQSFVRSIAAQLKNAGYDATAKPNDKLCQIVQRLLSFYGACPSDVSKMVREAIGK